MKNGDAGIFSVYYSLKPYTEHLYMVRISREKNGFRSTVVIIMFWDTIDFLP